MERALLFSVSALTPLDHHAALAIVRCFRLQHLLQRLAALSKIDSDALRLQLGIR